MRNIKKALSILLAIIIVLGTPIEALAQESDNTQTMSNAGTSNVPVIADAEPIVFKVVVSIQLPVIIDCYGNTFCANNATITNESSYGCVKVTSINVIAATGWTLIDYLLDFPDMPVNSKNVGMRIGNKDIDIRTGLADITSYNILNVGESQPLIYGVRIPPQSRGTENLWVCNIVVCVDWYK